MTETAFNPSFALNLALNLSGLPHPLVATRSPLLSLGISQTLTSSQPYFCTRKKKTSEGIQILFLPRKTAFPSIFLHAPSPAPAPFSRGVGHVICLQSAREESAFVLRKIDVPG